MSSEEAGVSGVESDPQQSDAAMSATEPVPVASADSVEGPKSGPKSTRRTTASRTSAKRAPAKTAASKRSKPDASNGRPRRVGALPRLFPRETIEDALQIPQALKAANGGNPWPPGEVAKYLNFGAKSDKLYYLTASSRDYGLTTGTRDASSISLTDLGRKAVYPASSGDEHAVLVEAFYNVEVFERVVRHFGGSELPERQYLSNTLTTNFGLPESQHDEFISIFERSCRFLGIGPDYLSSGKSQQRGSGAVGRTSSATVGRPERSVTSSGKDRVCFVIMPFSEKSGKYSDGFLMKF